MSSLNEQIFHLIVDILDDVDDQQLMIINWQKLYC